jgi:hypothetical protein
VIFVAWNSILLSPAYPGINRIEIEKTMELFELFMDGIIENGS